VVRAVDEAIAQGSAGPLAEQDPPAPPAPAAT
jgi:hypothetical protein